MPVADEEKLSEILTRMHEEDPTWIVEQSKEQEKNQLHENILWSQEITLHICWTRKLMPGLI